jgi:hypothetical protein
LQHNANRHRDTKALTGRYTFDKSCKLQPHVQHRCQQKPAHAATHCCHAWLVGLLPVPPLLQLQRHGTAMYLHCYPSALLLKSTVQCMPQLQP